MAKLYIFAVCDKVIIDQSGTASLIGLFNEVRAFLPPDSLSIPQNAVAPKEWFIFASWLRQPDDVGKEYRQLVQILYPDGTLFAQQSEARFVFEVGKSLQQNTVNIPGFPVGKPGIHTVKMWLETGGSIAFEPVSIDINVIHDRLAAAKT